MVFEFRIGQEKTEKEKTEKEKTEKGKRSVIRDQPPFFLHNLYP